MFTNCFDKVNEYFANLFANLLRFSTVLDGKRAWETKPEYERKALMHKDFKAFWGSLNPLRPTDC